MRNRYKVSKRQWARWGSNARNVFNTTYGTMQRSQALFTAPATATLPRVQWKTIAWNAAFIAACSVAP